MDKSQEKKNIVKYLTILWNSFIPKKRIHLFLILILMVLTTFLEIITISSLLPFLKVITNQDFSYDPHLQKFLITFNLSYDKKTLLVFFSILFVALNLLSGFLKILFLWLSTKISYSLGSDISLKLYKNVLYKPFSYHLKTNSSQVITNISQKAYSIPYNIILPTLQLISSVFAVTLILLTLLIINFYVSVVIFSGFTLIYFFVVFLFNNKLKVYSKNLSEESSNIVRFLQEGLGSIRDIILNSQQKIYSQIFEKSDKILKSSLGKVAFITQSPKYFVETLSMILIASIAFFYTFNTPNSYNVVPILGVFALAIQRLLPYCQQIYGSYTTIMASKEILYDVTILLEETTNINDSFRQNTRKIKFDKEIVLSNIKFGYHPNKYILKNININIKKGDRIGIIGSSGSGKSTLLNILMGLIYPTSGTLVVDNKNITLRNVQYWRRNIAHVPQSVFIIDDSLAQNIALGVPKDQINFKKCINALSGANLDNLLIELENGLNTNLGERGARLSGGQIQRIGIARALYKENNIIIFDEPTSSLDDDTEDSIIKHIETLDKNLTIIIATHKKNTLKFCNKVFNISKNEIINQ